MENRESPSLMQRIAEGVTVSLVFAMAPFVALWLLGAVMVWVSS